MFPPFDYFTYSRIRYVPSIFHAEYILTVYNSDTKRQQRTTRFTTLPQPYHTPLTQTDKETLTKPIQDLVRDIHANPALRHDILHTYGKIAVKAQEKTNCITELLLPEAERWVEEEVDVKGPLGGVPISLKDTIVVKGFDSSVGYTRYCEGGKGEKRDGAMVRLLKDAGEFFSNSSGG